MTGRALSSGWRPISAAERKAEAPPGGLRRYRHETDFSVIKLPNSAGLMAPSPTTGITGAAMDDTALDREAYSEKLDELDHLLNDADVPLEPGRVWSLLAELTRHDLAGPPREASP